MKEGTAGRRTGKRAAGVALIPEAPPLLYVEGHALREVSALLSWLEREQNGHVELRLATGPATRDEFSLDVEIVERTTPNGGDEKDANTIRELLHFTRIETVTTLHLALGLLIEKARESGWHDVKVEAVVSGGLPKFPAIVEG